MNETPTVRAARRALCALLYASAVGIIQINEKALSRVTTAADGGRVTSGCIAL